MHDRRLIQSYINDFRRLLSRYLKPGIGLASTVYPAEADGAILEFTLGSDIRNDDEYRSTYKSVNDALPELKQHAFAGNLGGLRFSGTNFILEPNRIILIKGGNSSGEWNPDGAAADIGRIVSRMSAPRAP